MSGMQGGGVLLKRSLLCFLSQATLMLNTRLPGLFSVAHHTPSRKQ